MSVESPVSFEVLVADLAATFVTLPALQVDDAIVEAQRRIVEALDLDRSVLFQRIPDSADLIHTHLWARPGAVVPPPRVSAREHFPWLLERALSGEHLAVEQRDEIPSRIDRESLAYFGTVSTVVVPLARDGQVFGALTFGTIRRQRAWSSETVSRLRLIGSVFASALIRKASELALRDAHEEVTRLKDQLERENVYLRQEVKASLHASVMIGHSAAMERVMEQVHQVAPTGATVLVQGETGTGKELVARQIHEASPRSGRLMVRVSCAAIPATLVESELFGREKGAYTGALSRQVGRFETADHSTIFLDEIGDLPPEVQVKLLRVLQEREIERLGSSRPMKVDVRVIAATHRDLERQVADGTFREDLYYRLNVFPIVVPPLRERPEDIPLLAQYFAQEFAQTFGKTIESVARDSLTALQQYSWPGNIRELRNIVERAVIVANGPRLVIPLPPRGNVSQMRSERLRDVERAHIKTVLQSAHWRIRGVGGAADRLGLKPSTLESRMSRLGLRRPAPGA